MSKNSKKQFFTEWKRKFNIIKSRRGKPCFILKLLQSAQKPTAIQIEALNVGFDDVSSRH